MTQCTATFEAGVLGAAVTAAAGEASATKWDAVSSTDAYSNTHAYGTLSAAMVAAGHYFTWSTQLGTVTDHYGRIYIYMTANPGAAQNTYQFVRAYSGASVAASIVTVNNAGKLVMGDIDSALGTSTASVSLNQWVRVEWHCIHSTTVGFIELKLFNDPDSATPTETLTSTSNNNTRASADSIRIGRDTGDSSGTTWIDNVVAGAASYPGSASPDAVPPALGLSRHTVLPGAETDTGIDIWGA